MTEFKEQKVSKWLVVVGMMMIFILVAGGWRWLVGDGGDAGGGGGGASRFQLQSEPCMVYRFESTSHKTVFQTFACVVRACSVVRQPR